MAPPAKIRRTSKADGASAPPAKRGLKLPPHMPPPRVDLRKPLHLVLATLVCTAVLITAASYLMPPIPRKGDPLPPAAPAPPPPVGKGGQSQNKTQPPLASAPAPKPQADSFKLPAEAAKLPAESQKPAARPVAPDNSTLAAVKDALREVSILANKTVSMIEGNHTASPPAHSAPAAPAPSRNQTQAAQAKANATAPAVKAAPPPDPPITAAEKAHVNSLRLARAENRPGRCALVLVSEKPFGRFKYLRLDGPPRVAVDLIGIWDSQAMQREVAEASCLRNLRLGKQPDRLRVVADLNMLGNEGPGEIAVNRVSPVELVISIPLK